MAHDLKRAVLALAVIMAAVEYINQRGLVVELIGMSELQGQIGEVGSSVSLVGSDVDSLGKELIFIGGQISETGACK